MLARRVPLLVLTTLFSLAAWSQTNTAAGAGTYPAQPEPNSTANLGVRPEVLPWDTGEAGLHLLAKKLKNTGRIMHLTAHPDDEDGALLTYLARGQGRQVLLMSLTRGEGGQNRTGSNLWDELGVLRTLELLESTRYYGTELRFSRVADFGFSKSADETFQKWGGHQVPLRDIVYVIREWKPDVLFTRFSGTPRDGHGMHQASAILAPEAVKCAADPNCFPDQLKGDHPLSTWQVLKLYMGNQGGDYTVRYDVSQVDPDTKLSYTQMALEGFKHQASQLSGNFTPPSGPNWRSYKLVSTAIPNYKPDKERDFFDGIDTTLAALKAKVDARVPRVSDITAKAISDLADAGNPNSTERLLSAAGHLLAIRNNASEVKDSDTEVRAVALLESANKLAEQELGIGLAAQSPLAFADPIKKVPVSAKLSNEGKSTISVTQPESSKVVVIHAPVEPLGRGFIKHSFSIEGAPFPLTRQHWYRADPERDTVYVFTTPETATLPLPPRPFSASSDYSYKNQWGAVETVVTTAATKWTPLAVANPISLLFVTPTAVVPGSRPQFTTGVDIRRVYGSGSGRVTLHVPNGWSVKPQSATFSLKDGDGSQKLSFELTPPKSGSVSAKIEAVADYNGRTFKEGFSTVTRPDLDTFYYYQPAIQRVSIVDVNVPKNLRVGYIPGAGDDIFPVLQQLGLNAKQISNDELAKGDLHQYDTIVVGIRGYDERPEIRANNQRLLEFVNDGGTLLVQNQKAEDVFNSGHFTPYPATLGRERVSVEEAPVTVLAPNDSVFNSPNKITPADFDGWVQERGINFMSDWDAKFEPLLASNDPGEQPLKGGLLRAKYGKGTYIYTGFAFFRQLPAGVPGAVRLYVNLLNAGHEAK